MRVKSISLPRIITALAGAALACGLFLAGNASAADMRPANAWLEEIPAPPQTIAAASKVCPEIRAGKEAIRTAYDRQTDTLDAKTNANDEEMSSAQAMALLMQGGGLAEMQKFADAQMQMANGEQSEKLLALFKRRDQAQQKLDRLADKRQEDIDGCSGKYESCGHFGEGMTAAEIACWDRREEKVRQCRKEAKNKYLQAAQSVLHEWKGDLRTYLDARESYLQAQEASHQNDYLRSQWTRQRVELLDLAAGYASMAHGVCGVAE